MISNSNNGKPGSGLWCVELVPKPTKLAVADEDGLVEFSKGMPGEPDKALVWMANAFTGLADHRTAHFARFRQRLVVFKEKRQAAAWARRETNEFWSGVVRAVRIV
jgi:hypothetical protein